MIRFLVATWQAYHFSGASSQSRSIFSIHLDLWRTPTWKITVDISATFKWAGVTRSWSVVTFWAVHSVIYIPLRYLTTGHVTDTINFVYSNMEWNIFRLAQRQVCRHSPFLSSNLFPREPGSTQELEGSRILCVSTPSAIVYLYRDILKYSVLQDLIWSIAIPCFVVFSCFRYFCFVYDGTMPQCRQNAVSGAWRKGSSCCYDILFVAMAIIMMCSDSCTIMAMT